MSPREPGRRKKSSKARRKGMDREETHGDCEWVLQEPAPSGSLSGSREEGATGWLLVCPTPHPKAFSSSSLPHWLICSPASAATVPTSHATLAPTWGRCPFCSQPGPCSPSSLVSAPLSSIQLALATGLILGRENATRDAVLLANFLHRQ